MAKIAYILNYWLPVIIGIIPKVYTVEVKANTQGSMQSLWIFMRKRQLHEAIRTSLENFGQFDHYDPKDNFEQRHVDIVPLYALSNLEL